MRFSLYVSGAYFLCFLSVHYRSPHILLFRLVISQGKCLFVKKFADRMKENLLLFTSQVTNDANIIFVSPDETQFSFEAAAFRKTSFGVYIPERVSG